MNLDAALPVGTIVLGWFLNRLSTSAQLKAASQQRRHDQRLEAYASYLTLAGHVLYGHGAASDLREKGKSLNTLMLLEPDESLRGLVFAVESAFPSSGSPELVELELRLKTDPEYSWEPFEVAADALRDAVRKDMTPR